VQERRWRRFPLQVPVQVRWTDTHRNREISGISRDVSSGGIYFFAENEIQHGSYLEITLHSLNCSGYVVRVEKQLGPKRYGIAVAFEDVHVIPVQAIEGPQVAV
jgi:PilZ domain-containing protein